MKRANSRGGTVKKFLMWLVKTLIISVFLTILSIFLVETKNTGCLDLCFFPEGKGFPFPVYNPSSYNYRYGEVHMWDSLLIDIPFWFIVSAVSSPIFIWLKKKHKVIDKFSKCIFKGIVFITVSFMIMVPLDMLLRPWLYGEVKSNTHLLDTSMSKQVRKFYYYSDLAKEQNNPELCNKVDGFYKKTGVPPNRTETFIPKSEAIDLCMRFFKWR